MILVKPSYEIMSCPENVLPFLELCARTCYKSEGRIKEGSAEKLIRRLVHDVKHLSVIEHVSITVRFIVDRGVSHELVRHRLCAFSQESTRYCNYGKAGQVTFVIPPWVNVEPGTYSLSEDFRYDRSSGDWAWMEAIGWSESRYLALLGSGWTPQQARSVLPNSLKTEIVTTTNLREWRHIFKLRTSKAAHPQIREVMQPLQKVLQQRIPIIFEED